MPFEGRQRAAALDRCWSIYLSLTRAFILPEEFHAEFPVAVESVLISSTLQFTVPIGSDLTLSLREEYVFDRQRLTVNLYSYNVIDITGNNVLRAVWFARITCLFIGPTIGGVYCGIRHTIFTMKGIASIPSAATSTNL
jgi:hypothetical protein